MGLDAIITWLWDKINEVTPWFIVKEYEQAVILRFGKFQSVKQRGIHWKIPWFDEVLTQHVVTTTINLPAQSLTTKDEKNIVVKAIVKYKVVDVKTFLLEVYDSTDAVSDVTQSIIKDIVMSSTWEQCKDSEIDNTLSKKVRVAIKKFGVEIERVTLTDIAPIRSLRLFNETSNIING